MVDELTLAVVGIDYPNADGSSRRFEIELCRPGDPIALRPEPTNEYDPSAVAVFRAGGGQLGYLTAERCGWVGQRMQSEGVLAIFQGLEGSAAYIRARFGGDPPALPPPPAEPRASAPPRRRYDPDAFYPDPDGPEWGA